MSTTEILKERTVGGLHESLTSHLPENIDLHAPVLDIGCGTGAWLHRLYSNGYRNLTGIDQDIRQYAGKECTVQAVNLNNTDWSAHLGTFRLITAIEVIEHLENVGSFLENLRALLTDDGTIILTTPNLHCTAARLRFLLSGTLRHFDDRGDPTHIYPVFMPNLVKLTTRHGLEIVEYWGYPNTGVILGARPWVSQLCSIVNTFFREDVPGDVLCLRIHKKQKEMSSQKQ
jgi:2-polyprenyl-3-methyl-5-hydroxy-6-metoxy-1,4-benzoquinol methylase